MATQGATCVYFSTTLCTGIRVDPLAFRWELDDGYAGEITPTVNYSLFDSSQEDSPQNQRSN